MRWRRHGFTLVELLVVITIIGILIALLLPAVQSAREAARRLQCSNNLKQMALAFHSYQVNWGVLPDAGKEKNRCDNTTHTPGDAPRGHWNWMYQILPYIEQANLYDEPNDITVQRTPVALYYCPTRRRPARYPDDSGSARSDYAGCSGDVMIRHGVYRSNGAMGARRCDPPVDFAMIRDGTSNTLLLGEKQQNPNYFGRSGGDNEPWCGSGLDTDQVRMAKLEHYEPIAKRIGGPPAPDSDELPGEPGVWSMKFGSSHPGVFNGALADGSVRSIQFSIDPETFRRLCVRNDGLPVTID